MTADTAKKILVFYGATLRRYGVRAERTGQPNPAHLVWMCEEAQTFEDDGKVMRWLGFVQGVLVAARLFTIEDAMQHSLLAAGEML